MLVGDYSFWEVLWWMIAFFAFVIWFWLLITVFGDLFRRHDIGGGGKTLWIIFIIFLPFLGVFIYLISQGKGMAERNMKSMEAAQAQQADYIKSVEQYNVTVRQFPANLTAMAFGYKTKANFTVENEREISKAPKVDFGQKQK